MKNRNFLKYSIGLLLPISLGIGVLFGVSKEEAIESSAYSGASLPTTIYLNDPSESTIRGYYSYLNNLEDSQRKGNNLLKNLKTILSNGQKYYNYDSGNLVWQMYEITDRDWDKSPASSTTYGTYDSEENKITNYVYGSSNSNGKNNPYVRAYYMDRNQENVVRAWGNHNQDATGINREHLWAKAEGFDGSGAAGARGDPMHLVAANGYANNIHSNYFYGYVDKTQSYEDVKDKYSTLGHNYRGYSKTYSTSKVKVFEPQDCDKGDIARAIFYMAARYNNIAGKSASEETFDADNPNLLLTNDLSTWKSSGYTSTATSRGYHGLVSDLLEWNRIDKPDAYEIHRNNLLYTNFTNNRNPFIDFPEWADYIWGNQSASATPATDSLNGGGSQIVTVTSIEVVSKPTKLIYESGESFDSSGMVVMAHKSDGKTKTLSSSEYTFSPNRALTTSDREITISYEGKSDSFDIAVRSSGGGSGGTVAPVGTTLLSEAFDDFNKDDKPTESGASTIVYGNGSVTYSCVDEGSITKIYEENSAGGTSPEILISKSGGSFTIAGIPTGGAKVINFTYKANNTVSLSCSSDYAVGGTNKNYTLTLTGSTAPETISLTLSNSSIKNNCCVDDIVVNVKTPGESEEENVDVSSITLNKNSTTLEIGNSEQLTATVLPENATVKLVEWSSSNSNVVEVDSNGIIVAKAAGTAAITCSALDESGVTATCSVTVNQPVTLQSISLSGDYPTEFYLDDEFSSTGMIVTAHYSDGSSVDVSEEAECTGFDPTSASAQTITVSYSGITTTYTVTVKESRLDSNQRLFIASKAGVGHGEVLDSYTDAPVTVTFSKSGGSNTPKYYSDKQSFRVYGGNSFTIAGTKKIAKIEFEMATGDYVGSNAISASEGSFSNNVWTGNAGSVVFTVAGTSGQRNIVSIKVTYDENSEDIKVLSGISLSGTYKTEFYKGDIFSYEGLVVTASYTDGSTAPVTPTSVSSPTMSTIGEKTVAVTYTENNITKNDTYTINVRNVGVIVEQKSVTLNIKTHATNNNWTNETKYSSIKVGDIDFSVSSGTNTGKYYSSDNTWRLYQSESATLTISAPNNAKIISITPEFSVTDSGTFIYSGNVVESATELNTNSQSITFSVGSSSGTNGKIRIKNIDVEYEIEKTLSSLTLSGDYKKTFNIGDSFSFGGIVTANFDDDSTPNVTSLVTFSGYDLSVAGQQTVTVSYLGKTTTYKIDVVQLENHKFYKVSGDLISGDYLMGYETTFANAVITSNKFGVSTLTNSNNIVSTNQDSNIFHIDICDGYVTILSKSQNKYLAGTGSNYTIGLEATVTNSAKWTLTKNASNDGYCFTNISNSTSGKSPIFRGNGKTGTYFACYSSDESLNYLSLYRLKNTAYVKAEDLSWIQDGDHITFGYTYGTDKFVQSSNDTLTSGMIYPTDQATYSDNIYTVFKEEAIDYVVEMIDGNYSFKCKLGYLSGVSSTTIQYLSNNEDSLSQFTLTNDGFKCVGINGSDRFIRFNYNNGINPRIGMYTKSVSHPCADIYIAKESGEARKWSSDFLASTNACTDLSHWSEFGTLYNNLSNEAKTALKDAVGDQFSSSIESQAMARYDYILGDSRYKVTAFITERGQNNTRKVNILALDDIDTSIYIVAIVLAVGLTAIGGYFFYKKKKEDRV